MDLYDFDKRMVVEDFGVFQAPLSAGNITNSTTRGTPLTQDQLEALQITTKITASASMLGSGLIILSFIIFPSFRTLNNRLLLYLSISGKISFLFFLPSEDQIFFNCRHSWIMNFTHLF
jgi:hypothetical protein